MKLTEGNDTDVKSVEVLNCGGDEDGVGHATDELVVILLVGCTVELLTVVVVVVGSGHSPQLHLMDSYRAAL